MTLSNGAATPTRQSTQEHRTVSYHLAMASSGAWRSFKSRCTYSRSSQFLRVPAGRLRTEKWKNEFALKAELKAQHEGAVCRC